MREPSIDLVRMKLRYKLHPSRDGSSCPAGSAAPALLLLLHGTGDNEGGLLPLGGLAPEGTVVASLRAPLAAPFGGFRWFPGMSSAPEPDSLTSVIGESTDSIFDFIDSAPSSLGTDPNRVYLMGFSQGATLTWAALMSTWPRPGFIAGALVVSGRLMPEFLQPDTPLGARCAPPTQLDGTSLLVTHGACDNVTPVVFARESARLYESWRGAPLDLRELERDEHGVSQQCQHLARKFLHEQLEEKKEG